MPKSMIGFFVRDVKNDIKKKLPKKLPKKLKTFVDEEKKDFKKQMKSFVGRKKKAKIKVRSPPLLPRVSKRRKK